MVKNKMFFFDMDGTLLPHGENQRISDYDIYGLQQLEKNGYEVVLNTGKSYSMCLEQFKQYNFKTSITSNGQHIVRDDKELFVANFSEEQLIYWINYAKEHGLNIGFQTNQEQYILNTPNAKKYRDICFANLNVAMPLIVDELPKDIVVLQVWILGEQVNLELIDTYDYFKWHEFAFDVQIKGTNKGSAVKSLLNSMTEEFETYCFGDGNNDVPMFSVCDISVAMGHANDYVKSNATELTDSIYDSGVYQYLVRNNFIDAMEK